MYGLEEHSIASLARCNSLPIAHISPIEPDHGSLCRILKDPCCELYNLRTRREARRWLSSHYVELVICESSLPDGSWKDILDLVRGFSKPPNLIVSSRLADDRLWAEVLNLGAYDLLATPFQAGEVLHSVKVACHFWDWEKSRAVRPLKPQSSTVSGDQTERILAAGAD